MFGRQQLDLYRWTIVTLSCMGNWWCVFFLFSCVKWLFTSYSLCIMEELQISTSSNVNYRVDYQMPSSTRSMETLVSFLSNTRCSTVWSPCIPDSEWAFALFLSKVCVLAFPPLSAHSCTLQLQDPQAKSFTPEILRKAMLETIASLNILAEEANITEVCRSYHLIDQVFPLLCSQVLWTSVSRMVRVL